MLKPKPKGKAKRMFHYTIGKYLPKIIHDGQINVATALTPKKREQAAWASTNELWEETANKMFLMSDGTLVFSTRETTHQCCGGLARIEVRAESVPFNWKRYAKKSKLPGIMKRGLEEVSQESGASPNEWYASFKPIKSNDWLAIETFDWESQTWRPYEQN